MKRLLVLAILMLPLSANAATKYVSPSGTEAWANCNTSGSPCSVATANANAVAGDIVRFLSGDYFPPNASSTQEPAWHPANSGTVGNPITYISDVRHGAVIHSAANQSSTANRTGFGCYAEDYITIDGFTIDSDGEASTTVQHPFIIESCRHVIVQYMSFPTGWAHSDHTNGASIGVYGNAVREGSDIHIRYCDINGPTNDLTPTEAVVNASGIYMFEVTDVHVYNNTIHDVNNAVSWKVSPDHIYVHHNYIYNVNRAAFYITPEVNGLDTHHVHHNVLRNVNRVFDAEEAPSGGGTWTGFQFYNNTVYNDASTPLGRVYVAPSGTANVSGIALGTDGGPQTARGAVIYNNIFQLSTTSRGWEIHDDLTSDAMIGVPFDYNVYYISSGTLTLNYNGTGYTTLANWVAALSDSEEANSSSSNPVFLNGSGSLNTVNDFKLNPSTSPFLSNGYGSVQRGAFEGDACIGATCSAASSTGGGMDVRQVTTSPLLVKR